eukprot:TRINITY_DN3_c0_g1_i2.p1 TRINITY_DN3_c0_g1~~TRINITY_DN3_c0_g1_i2.p1  ORF type:complete len:181 (-),score=77.85 TRINITY_DN3_c0_g1_i2:184-660(-)
MGANPFAAFGMPAAPAAPAAPASGSADKPSGSGASAASGEGVSVGSGSGSGAAPSPNGMGAGMGAGPAGQNPFDLSALMAAMQGFQPNANANANAAANPFAMFGMPAQPQVQPEIIYRDQLRQLTEMGFFDPDANLRALISTGGDVNAAVNILLAQQF